LEKVVFNRMATKAIRLKRCNRKQATAAGKSSLRNDLLIPHQHPKRNKCIESKSDKFFGLGKIFVTQDEGGEKCVDQNTSKNNEGVKHAGSDFNKDFLWQRDFVGFHEETAKKLIICFSFYF
jgi:hypothetical protein